MKEILDTATSRRTDTRIVQACPQNVHIYVYTTLRA